MKHVVLLSGGMDSAYLLWVKCQEFGPENVTGLVYDYGQSNTSEVEISQKLGDRFGCRVDILSLPGYRDICVHAGVGTIDGYELTTNVTLPHKNMVFVSLGLAYAEGVGAESISLGVVKSDTGFWDASPLYFRHLRACSNIQIQTPLIEMSKEDIAGCLQAIDIDIGVDTTSCYHGHECGRCGSCYSSITAKAKAKQCFENQSITSS